MAIAPRNARRLFTSVVCAVFAACLLVSQVSALSADQKSIFDEGVNYFDINGSCGTTVTPGNGTPTGLTFPNLDPTSMANAIDTYIKQTNPNSELSGDGQTIVASAKHANVNPFFVVAIAQKESSLADPTDFNTSHANNAFGRTAVGSQPSLSGSKNWYKWSSVQASVDYTAPENNQGSNSDEVTFLEQVYGSYINNNDLSGLINKYAPSSDGNDPTEYAQNVQKWIDSMASLAGGAAPVGAQSTVNNVYILGDSVTAASEAAYKTAFPGITLNIDAADGRSLTKAGNGDAGNTNNDTGFQALENDDTNDIKQAQAIVIALGTSGDDTAANINKAVSDIRTNNPTAPIYWVNTFGLAGSNFGANNMGTVNTAIANGAGTNNSTPNYQVIDWARTVDPTVNPQSPGTGGQDPNSYISSAAADLGVNPTAAGSTALANAVAQAVTGSGNAGGAGQCSCSSGSSTTLTGTTPAAQAFNYYIQKGLSVNAAAGLVGNFMSESGGDTENLQPSITNSNGGAHGIAQWLGNRLTNLENFATSNNEPEDNLSTQLDFSWQELTSSYASSVLNPIQAASTPSAAADIVNTSYEASGVAPTTREANAITLANEYGGGSGGGGGSTPSPCAGSSSPPGTTSSGISAYQNPLRDVQNLGQSRVDQGVDYTGSGPVYAIGNGTVKNLTNSGWPGGTFIVYQLSDGPAAGKYVYFGENCDNIQVHIGETVTSNSVLCDMVNASPNIETGWADSTLGEAAAAAVWVGHDSDSYYTAYGLNFSQLLKALGAPSGIVYPGAQELGSLPSGWPTWQ